MLDILKLISEATFRAHLSRCEHDHVGDPNGCKGPDEQEMAIAAAVVASTMPKILAKVGQQFRQALHALEAGQTAIGDPDAMEDPERLLLEWFRWWRSDPEAPVKMPEALHVRTAAYLTAKAVQDGRRVRTVHDL